MLKAKVHKTAGTSFNFDSAAFIPAACHYDAFTLLTKNGELVQTIQVRGTFSQSIGDDLTRLRDIIRDTIRRNIHNDDFAFWIHTVRRKTNLDDQAEYPDILSENVHKIWRDKNYWHDKFINTLYISIVHKKPEINIYDISTIIKSLSNKYVTKLYDQHFTQSLNALNDVVSKMMADLQFFGVHRLQIIEENEVCYSEPLFLLRRIIHLNENNILLPITDLSAALGTHKYAIGDNQLEVMDEVDKKFASILSIKEYHEMSEGALDNILRLSLEFIATEVFYFVPKADATKPLEYMDYILGVSRDSALREVTTGPIIDASDESEMTFCHQQISIMIISDDIESLVEDTTNTSKALSRLGIVHAQEDINLEQVFWSQLPGNFAFLKRTTPNVVTCTAALASLHNFPTGNAINPWGKAITLCRTAKGTPHFVNFHNKDGVGHTLFYGPSASGRSVMLNFLLSETMKFHPTVIYIAFNTKPQIFFEAIGGTWRELTKEKFTIAPSELIGFNLQNADAETVYQIVSNALELMSNMEGNGPKILVLGDVTLCLQDEKFAPLIEGMLQSITKNNGIILGSVNLHKYKDCYTKPVFQTLFAGLGCQIILTDDKKDLDVKTILSLTDAENSKLKSFTALSRLFILKQDGRSIVLEFSLGNKPGVLKMLSCSDKDLAICAEVKAKVGADSDEWIIELYEKLSTNVAGK